MIGHSKWSYAPYRPPMTAKCDIYICRIVPEENSVYINWLETDCKEYEIYYRERGCGDFIRYCIQRETECTIKGLKENTDYEFYVKSEEKKSIVRLARCAKTIGTVVNYLHPDDCAYEFSGRYLCSPSLAVHPDGYILASMDLFNHRDAQNLTLIFRSDDGGKTWRYMCELMPCFWGKLFVWKNDIYMLSCSTEFGDLLIGKSTNGGKSFDAPTVIFRGSNGKLGKGGFHKNPQNILLINNRLYTTIEWSCWDSERQTLGPIGVMLLSCSEDADLMKPESWTLTEPKIFNPDDAPEISDLAKNTPTIEGTPVLSPDGDILNIMRFGKDGHAIVYRADKANPEAMLKYDRLMNFDAHLAKFMIRYDEKSKKYLTIANYIYDYEIKRARNMLCLMVSDDLNEWKIVSVLHDRRNEDWFYSGVQYAAFEFVGDDLIYLARTAINNPHNYHDANYSTFHRIENFRSIL